MKIRCIKKGNIGIIQTPLLFYRVHDKQISNMYIDHMKTQSEKICQNQWREVIGRYLDKSEMHIINRLKSYDSSVPLDMVANITYKLFHEMNRYGNHSYDISVIKKQFLMFWLVLMKKRKSLSFFYIMI